MSVEEIVERFDNLLVQKREKFTMDTSIRNAAEVQKDDVDNIESLDQLPVHKIEEIRANIKLRVATQWTLLGLFIATNVTTLGLFWFTACKQRPLSDVALGELAAMTTAEVAGLLYVSARYLFPGLDAAKRDKPE